MLIYSGHKLKKKCYTDITKFQLNNGDRTCLSLILGKFNSEIIFYDVSKLANLGQIIH